MYNPTASTSRSRCDTNAATGVPIEIPAYHNGTGLRSHPLHDGPHLRHRTHHARDVAQRIHVRIGRPLAPPAAVAGLHRHRDIEPQLVMDAPDTGQHQVFGAALTGAVHPDQPRPRSVAVSAYMHHRPGRSAQALRRQGFRQRRVMLERQPLVCQTGDALRS